MTPEASRAAVEARAVSKTFERTRVLADVDLAMHPGRVHALLGQNGSGKSTLIRSMAGYVEPDPGSRIVVEGTDLPPGRPERSKAMGLRFVHQDLALVGQLDAVENVAIANGFERSRLGRIDWPRTRRRVEAQVRRFNPDLDVTKPVRECRQVERSTVAIARALEHGGGRITALILDEPTAALPPPEVEQLFEVIEQVRDSGVAVLYVSHRLQEVFRIADDVTILRDGRVEWSGSIGSTSMEAVAGIIIGAGQQRTASAPPPDPASAEVVDGAPAPPAMGTAAPPAMGNPTGAPQGPWMFEVEELAASNLAGLSFRVREGEVVGIAGLAGSGREEVAAALAGAVEARATRIAVAGAGEMTVPTPRGARELGIGYVRSSWSPGGAIREMSVAENLTLASLDRYATLGRFRLRAERQDTGSWIQRMRIRTSGPGQALHELSGGNQQKVVVAKWLNAQVRVLLLEEPTGGVDVGAKAELYELFRALAADGSALLVSSSDATDFVGVCHRVLVLRDGRICAELSGEAVTEEQVVAACMGVEGVQ